MVELFIIGLYVQIVFLLRSLEIHTDMGHEGPLGFEGTQNGRKGPSAIAITIDIHVTTTARYRVHPGH